MSGDSEMMDRLAAAAKAGRLSRRGFLGSATAAGVTAATASGLWATHARAEPKRGGTFRWGIHDGNTTDSHDPATYTTRQQAFLAFQHRSTLTMIASDNTLAGDLATEWSATPDATEWTFKITDKASFHSGRKLTAEDVVASLNHHRGADSTSAAKELLGAVTEIVADDAHTVTIKLSGGNADLPWLLTDYHFVICPANTDGSIEWRSGDGSGPYRIDNGEFGVRWDLSRFDGWHGEGAYFDKVVMLILNDANARQTALMTGDVDCISLVEVKTLSLLQRAPNIEIDNVASGSAITMPMFCDRAPFDNPDVRMALKLAMDREEIVEKIAFGAGTIGNDFHLTAGQPYFPADIPQREYDPEQAKFLLKKAGAEGLSISLHAADNVLPGAVDMCVLYSEQAKKAGIDITPVRAPNDGYYADVWMKQPFTTAAWGPRPTPDVIFTQAYQAGAVWNESHWDNERFNELLPIARAELDDAKRAEMYREMCMLMRDDGGTIIPFFNNFVYARSSKVRHGPEQAANWECDGARAPSRWWFA
ncbi:ABC transporter substrate-binding protein [Pikeienuella sp. HZG-20]|uniref:ABC transporter substrate-binding protein n=1 Tax=Paludibacillus litoralis TaxID=3133267 RepID=UPI0030EF36A0